MKLAGKAAVVTGSSRGVGRNVAIAFAKEGADVLVNYTSSKAPAQELVEAIRAMGRKSVAVRADVASKAEVEEMMAAAKENFGRLDILVNNAGVNRRVPVLEFTEEAWDLVIDTNLKGYFLVSQAVVPQMLARGYGKIINMSSILGTVALPNQLAYASSKGGVDQLTKVMATASAVDFATSERRVRFTTNGMAPRETG